MQHTCSTTNRVRVVATLPPDPLKKKKHPELSNIRVPKTCACLQNSKTDASTCETTCVWPALREKVETKYSSQAVQVLTNDNLRASCGPNRSRAASKMPPSTCRTARGQIQIGVCYSFVSASHNKVFIGSHRVSPDASSR